MDDGVKHLLGSNMRGVRVRTIYIPSFVVSAVPIEPTAFLPQKDRVLIQKVVGMLAYRSRQFVVPFGCETEQRLEQTT